MKTGAFGWWAAFALLTAPPAEAAAAEPPPPLPLPALAELPFISEPILSPDGTKILSKVNVHGSEQIAIYDLKSGTTETPHAVPHFGRVRWYGWAGNDRVLVGQVIVTLVLGVLPLPITRLTRYDVGTKKLIPIGEGKGLMGDDVIFTDPDGRFVLLSAQRDFDDSPSVSRVDLATGASVEVQKKKAGIWNWFTDGTGTIRGGIAYDKGNWTAYARDPASGALRKAASGKVSAKESVVDSITLMPGTDKGVIVTNEATGRFGVYAYSLTDQAVGAPIYEHPEADVKSVQFSSDYSQVEGVFYEDDKLRSVWFTPELKKVQTDLDKTFPNKINRILNLSRDRNRVLLWTGGADDPGTYYVFDRKARQMIVFAAPFDGLVDKQASPVKPIRYKARDGLSIPGYLALPAGREAKNLPLIVLPHGGPFARDSYSFDPLTQMLASRGYAVLKPNFRGSTGYGRDYVERGYGQWGTAMQDDLDDGVAWLARDGVIDPARVCIVGGSYGGYAALWGAIRNPEIYKCAVSIAGVTDVRAMLKYDAKALLTSRYSKQWRSRVEGEEKRDLAAISPLQQAGRLNVPVLIAHGDLDSNVPVDQGRKMVAALKARKAAVHSAFYPKAGHSFETSEDNLDFMKRVDAFLELYNPVAPPKGPRTAALAAGDVKNDEFLALLGKKKTARAAVDVRFLVDADGRVSSCSVAVPSGAKPVDDKVCGLVEERFLYRPALSAAGKSEQAWLSHAFTWQAKAAK
jgi:dipeptidyl aminopeptidase/acylaminoacyl peptidase